MPKLTPRAQEMLAILRRHSAGEPLSQLASEAGVAPNTMTWWRHRLREALAQPPMEFVEFSVEPDDAGTVDAEASPPITVVLDDLRIELPTGFSATDLTRALEVLRRC